MFITVKMAVFWDVASFSVVETDRRFRDACCAMMIQAVSTFETSVNFYQTARSNIPENIHLHFKIICRVKVQING
jgi:hypothetical protein